MINWGGVAFVILAYFIGAIPTGFIIAKKLKGIDIREHGSGNVGATNVKRVVGNKAGMATLFMDFLKGLLPVLAALYLFPPSSDIYQVIPVLTGAMAVIGHSKSIYIGFSGGKSVITSLGVLIALEPIPALIIAIAGLAAIKITRYVSVGSILASILLPILVWLRHDPLSHLVLSLFLSVYVIYLHRGNIQRLIHHQENRI